MNKVVIINNSLKKIWQKLQSSKKLFGWPSKHKKNYTTRSTNLNKNLHFCFPKNNHTEPKKCKFLIMSSLYAHAFSTKFRVIYWYILWVELNKEPNFLFYHKQHIILSSSINWINKQSDRYIVNYVDSSVWRRYTWELK